MGLTGQLFKQIGWICLAAALLNTHTAASSQPRPQSQSLPQVQAQTTNVAPRIVALAPHLAQLAHTAGGGQYLVGVSDYTPIDFAKALPSVGNAFAVNWQQIAALKPTLVLVWGSGTSAAVKAKLKALGLSTFESEPSSLAGIVDEAQGLAALLGQSADHPSLTALQAQLNQLRQFNQLQRQHSTAGNALETAHAVPVFHPIWPRPLMTINARHVISDALRYCGARNVFAHAKGLTPTVTLQQVLREKPAVIVIAQSASEAQLNTQWQSLLKAFPATHTPKTVIVNGDFFHQPGPGLIGETVQLCEALKQLKQLK